MASIDESSIAMRNNDPYSFLNEKNAILLNCKNPKLYNEVCNEVM